MEYLLHNQWLDFGHLEDFEITFKLLWLLCAFFTSFSNGSDTKKVNMHDHKKSHWGKGKAKRVIFGE